MGESINIIAELAQGFEGRPEQARLLLRAAAATGADAAKYQLVYADELASRDYQHYNLFRSLEMRDDTWQDLSAEARDLGIALQLDIFGLRSLALAEQIHADAVKIHGTDVANEGLLFQVARSSAPKVLLGAGGSHAEELTNALEILATKPVVVILGFQGYPTPDDANQIARVAVVSDLCRRLHPNAQVGFADHTNPVSSMRFAVAATAIGAGATVIEKHLTLGRPLKLEDYESALNPDEFEEFTRTMRGCARAIGTATSSVDFGMSVSEGNYRQMIRRQVVAGRDLPAGTVLQPSDIVLKRTSADDAVTNWGRAHGQTLKRNLLRDSPVRETDFE